MGVGLGGAGVSFVRAPARETASSSDASAGHRARQQLDEDVRAGRRLARGGRGRTGAVSRRLSFLPASSLGAEAGAGSVGASVQAGRGRACSRWSSRGRALRTSRRKKGVPRQRGDVWVGHALFCWQTARKGRGCWWWLQGDDGPGCGSSFRSGLLACSLALARTRPPWRPCRGPWAAAQRSRSAPPHFHPPSPAGADGQPLGRPFPFAKRTRQTSRRPDRSFELT